MTCLNIHWIRIFYSPGKMFLNKQNLFCSRRATAHQCCSELQFSKNYLFLLKKIFCLFLHCINFNICYFQLELISCSLATRYTCKSNEHVQAAGQLVPEYPVKTKHPPLSHSLFTNPTIMCIFVLHLLK